MREHIFTENYPPVKRLSGHFHGLREIRRWCVYVIVQINGRRVFKSREKGQPVKQLDVLGGLFVRNFVQHQGHGELGKGPDGIHKQYDSGNSLIQVEVSTGDCGNGSG